MRGELADGDHFVDVLTELNRRMEDPAFHYPQAPVLESSLRKKLYLCRAEEGVPPAGAPRGLWAQGLACAQGLRPRWRQEISPLPPGAFVCLIIAHSERECGVLPLRAADSSSCTRSPPARRDAPAPDRRVDSHSDRTGRDWDTSRVQSPEGAVGGRVTTDTF